MAVFPSLRKGDRLLVSSVGYTLAEVLVESVTDIRLTLKPKAVNLDEILLTGYTYQRVKEIAGSVASVKPKDLVSIPAGQVEQMLQGRAAGLNVITSGEPGSPSKVRLHGIGNFGDVTRSTSSTVYRGISTASIQMTLNHCKC